MFSRPFDEQSEHRVVLTGFTWADLSLLHHHLAYAVERLCMEQEMAYARWLYQPAQAGQQASFRRLADLMRDHDFFAYLAEELVFLLSGDLVAQMLQPGSEMLFDLSGVLGGSQVQQALFLSFLQRECKRSRGAVNYVKKQTFDQDTEQEILDALDLEIKFFEQLAAYIERWVMPPPLLPGQADGGRIPLLFISLPELATSQVLLSQSGV